MSTFYAITAFLGLWLLVSIPVGLGIGYLIRFMAGEED